MLERQLAYWRRQLGGARRRCELPTDRPRPPVLELPRRERTSRAAARRRSAARSQTLGQREGATLFMTLLAAFQALLCRYTGQDDIVVGSPIANRNRAEIEGLIGFFVNTWCCAPTCRATRPSASCSARVRETALGAYAHQDLPFEKLVEELQPERDLSRNPLFQVDVRAAERAGRRRSSWRGLTVRAVGHRSRRHAVRPRARPCGRPRTGSAAAFEYSTDLFDARDHRAPVRAPAHAARRPWRPTRTDASPSCRCSPRPSASRRARGVERHDAAVPAGRPPSTQLFEAQAARTPDAVARRGRASCSSTYGELDRRANQLAHRLRALGVGPEAARRRLPGAVARAGRRPARRPEGRRRLRPARPGLPAERLAYMLEDARCCRSSLTHARPCAERVPRSASPVECRCWSPRGGGDTASGRRGARAAGRPRLRDLHLGLHRPAQGRAGRAPRPSLNHLRWTSAALRLGPRRGVAAAVARCRFDASVCEIWCCRWSTGATVVLLPDARVASVRELGIVAAPQRVTRSADARPRRSCCAQLLDARAPAGRCARDAAHRRRGAAAPSSPQRLAAAAADRGSCNVYGPTEDRRSDAAYRGARRRPGGDRVPIGRPIANTRLYVLDRHLRAGAGRRARRALHRRRRRGARLPGPARADRRALRARPVRRRARATRLYRTGDLVRWRPDGALEFLGRARPPGQAARLPHRAGRDRGGARRRTPRCARPRSLVARGRAGRPAPGGLRRAARPGGRAPSESARPGPDAARRAAGRRSTRRPTAEAAAAEDATFDIRLEQQLHRRADPRRRRCASGWTARSTRILALQPRRVLEIGCGTGLLLFRVAPGLRALRRHRLLPARRLDRHAAARSGATCPRSRCRQRPADDFRAWRPASFDLVVLNSVVQYFPGVDYLVRVLEGAVGVPSRPAARSSSATCAACRCSRPSTPRSSCSRRPRRCPSSELRPAGAQGGWPRRRSWSSIPAFFPALAQRLPRDQPGRGPAQARTPRTTS